jgi:cytochrome c oxidase cbb3-type subunit 3
MEHIEAARLAAAPTTDNASLWAMSHNHVFVEAGRATYATTCVSCHGDKLQGGIGPNLTDDYWIHGRKMSKILAVIKNGVADKGMPPWGALLKKDELIGVVSYVTSLRGTGPAGAKEPQGELEKDDN